MRGKVNESCPPKGEPTWGEMTNNAAHGLFITELGRGMAVTLGHIFKEPATINYPFEKGPLSPRFRGEHALRRYIVWYIQTCVSIDPTLQIADTQAGRRGVLPASSVRPSVLPRQIYHLIEAFTVLLSY